MKNKYVPTGVFHYPKPEDEPKGYIHFHNAKSVKPEWGDVAPSFVNVYMNLKLNCLSIVNKQTNRIFCNAHNVKMRNVEFVVKARKNNNANNYRKKSTCLHNWRMGGNRHADSTTSHREGLEAHSLSL